MEPLEEARHYLAAADRLRAMPFAQFPGNPGGSLAEYERRDREVLQLHIRAMVAAAAVVQRASCKACQGHGTMAGRICDGCHGAGEHRL